MALYRNWPSVLQVIPGALIPGKSHQAGPLEHAVTPLAAPPISDPTARKNRSAAPKLISPEKLPARPSLPLRQIDRSSPLRIALRRETLLGPGA
jgi:hypothetical protein